MASSFGFSTNPDSKVKPLNTQPIDQHRQWNRAGEVGYFDNASRAFQTQGDWTQERSLSGANKGRAATRGTSSMRMGTIAGSAPSVGYVNMGSSGPAPLGGPPQSAEIRAPLLPNALAQGVPGRFTNDPAHNFSVSGKTGAFLGKALYSGFAASGRRGGDKPTEEEPTPEEPQPREIGQGGGTVPATVRPSTVIPRQQGTPVRAEPVYQGEIVDEIGTTYPAIGEGIIDVESWETSGELERGRTAGVNRQADRAIGPDTFALGPGDPDMPQRSLGGVDEKFAIGTNDPSPRDRFGRSQTRGGRNATGTRSDIIEIDGRPSRGSSSTSGRNRSRDTVIPFNVAGESQPDLADAMRQAAIGREYPYYKNA